MKKNYLQIVKDIERKTVEAKAINEKKERILEAIRKMKELSDKIQQSLLSLKEIKKNIAQVNEETVSKKTDEYIDQNFDFKMQFSSLNDENKDAVANHVNLASKYIIAKISAENFCSSHVTITHRDILMHDKCFIEKSNLTCNMHTKTQNISRIAYCNKEKTNQSANNQKYLKKFFVEQTTKSGKEECKLILPLEQAKLELNKAIKLFSEANKNNDKADSYFLKLLETSNLNIICDSGYVNEEYKSFCMFGATAKKELDVEECHVKFGIDEINFEKFFEEMDHYLTNYNFNTSTCS